MIALLPQGSLPWLVAHEIRLGWRGAVGRMQTRSRLLGYVLLALWIGMGCYLGWVLRDAPFHFVPRAGDVVLAITIGLFTFMVTQAMLASQQALYGAGDLDLLLSAPIGARPVLRAKLIGIAGSILLFYAVVVMPLLVPIAVLGHPGFFGAVALFGALALVAACLGLAITLIITRLAGPRAARTAGQIAAAVLGGALFLLSQLASHGERSTGRVAIFEMLRRSGIGETMLGSLPGKAAFGDPVALAVLIGIAALVFSVTGMLFERRFLASWQAASMRLSSNRRHTSTPIDRHFRRGLFGAVFAKEWLLLARDPALAFQIVLRLIYLLPLAFVALGREHPVPPAPGLAFASVLVVGQLTGSFAFLTISAEDSPDLLVVAPVEKEQVEIAKLLAALAMAAPISLLLPAAVVLWSPIGAAITLFLTAIAGVLAGLIELKLGKPAPRASFNRRRSGSAVAGILAGLVTLAFGSIAGLSVYALGGA